MFNSARIKLTAWYLMIIMLVSITFSCIIYKALTVEVERFERVQRLRLERRFFTPEFLTPQGQVFRLPMPITNPESITETTHRLLIVLIFLNGAIFITSGGLGYLLAGRTLRPIQEMVEEQNRFISDASHELRTPLTALKASLEVTLRDKNMSVSDARQVLKDNLEDVDKLQSLSDKLLRLTHYQDPTVPVIDNVVSAKELVVSAVAKMSAVAMKKDITITNSLRDFPIFGNKESLQELFGILLDNAIKYSPEKSTILIKMACTNTKGTIAIIDHGIGIARKDIPHVFDRFYRGDASRSRSVIFGYGLGLSIAKKIVENHHGSIAVTKSSRKGSTFEVTFPLSKRDDDFTVA